MYVYCVVCYCVTAAPYVKSVGCVFAYRYTLGDDSECPMDYDTSLLLKFFLQKIQRNYNRNFMLSRWESCIIKARRAVIDALIATVTLSVKL